MSNALDLLLKATVPDAPKEQVKQLRLSKICGEDVIFELQALTYAQEKDIERKDKENMNVFTILAGVKSPNLKDKNLLEKFGAETPAELVKKMLLPGEIVDLARKVEMLSGFRVDTLEAVEEAKKK